MMQTCKTLVITTNATSISIQHTARNRWQQAGWKSNTDIYAYATLPADGSIQKSHFFPITRSPCTVEYYHEPANHSAALIINRAYHHRRPIAALRSCAAVMRSYHGKANGLPNHKNTPYASLTPCYCVHWNWNFSQPKKTTGSWIKREDYEQLL